MLRVWTARRVKSHQVGVRSVSAWLLQRLIQMGLHRLLLREVLQICDDDG